MLLKKITRDYRIILASASPRRKQLLEECEIEFCQSPAYEVEEIYPEGLDANKVSSFLSELKADGYPYKILDKDILVTADTVVIVDGVILGKPANRASAIEMLECISGREHTVMTSYTLRNSDETITSSVETSVVFTDLSREDIEYYIDRYRPFDKAGSYGIQEWIGCIGVKSINGSFYNVMGLPVHALLESLKEMIATMERRS